MLRMLQVPLLQNAKYTWGEVQKKLYASAVEA
jgi:hypothetical protein